MLNLLPDSPLFCVILYLIAFATAYLLSKQTSMLQVSGRYETIDGFRGLLALGVFIHHTVVWYGFIHQGEWKFPSSNFITHLGDSGVVFFFMITGFLFTIKILGTEKYDWKQFFISRFFRLVPLYFFVIIVVIFIVFAASGFQLLVSIKELFCSFGEWFSFTIIGNGPINNFEDTRLVTAGVTWSLPYEWLFYFSLPVLSLLLFRKVPLWALLFVAAFMIFFFYFSRPDINYVVSFAGGIAAAFAKKLLPAKTDFNHPGFSVLLIALFILVPLFPDATPVLAKVVLSCIFILVALGNDLFGFFKLRFMKFLGEISYSTYMIHGILLFLLFNFVLERNLLNTISDQQYIVWMSCLTPVVVIASFITYRFIEKPFMDLGRKIQKRNSGKD